MAEKTLPIYEAILEEWDTINWISIVDQPAIEADFLHFSKEDAKKKMEYAIQSEDKRIIVSPVCIPEKLIYRYDSREELEYYIKFTKETIELMQLNYFKYHIQQNVDTQHNEQWEQGCTVFSSFISNEELGINAPKGFEDLPWGTWFIQMKIENDLVWENIKNGTFKGVSLSGFFDMKPVNMSKEKNYDKALEDMYFSMFK